jgi:hypothetical protein
MLIYSFGKFLENLFVVNEDLDLEVSNQIFETANL